MSPEYGHAVLLYDDRNSAFVNGGVGNRAFKTVKNALKDSLLLRRCSWQVLAGKLLEEPQLRWLVDAMALKYGILACETECV